MIDIWPGFIFCCNATKLLGFSLAQSMERISIERWLDKEALSSNIYQAINDLGGFKNRGCQN